MEIKWSDNSYTIKYQLENIEREVYWCHWENWVWKIWTSWCHAWLSTLLFWKYFQKWYNCLCLTITNYFFCDSQRKHIIWTSLPRIEIQKCYFIVMFGLWLGNFGKWRQDYCRGKRNNFVRWPKSKTCLCQSIIFWCWYILIGWSYFSGWFQGSKKAILKCNSKDERLKDNNISHTSDILPVWMWWSYHNARW